MRGTPHSGQPELSTLRARVSPSRLLTTTIYEDSGPPRSESHPRTFHSLVPWTTPSDSVSLFLFLYLRLLSLGSPYTREMPEFSSFVYYIHGHIYTSIRDKVPRVKENVEARAEVKPTKPPRWLHYDPYYCNRFFLRSLRTYTHAHPHARTQQISLRVLLHSNPLTKFHHGERSERRRFVSTKREVRRKLVDFN